MFKKILLAALAACVSACASPYVATPYDRSAHNVRTIVVIDDAAEERGIAYEVASLGSNFGLIGVLADATVQDSRQRVVNEALDGVGFDAEAILEQRLDTALEGQDYTVSVQSGFTRPKRDFLVSYPTASGDTDAYLDVVIVYGYVSAGFLQPFRPHVTAQVRLVSAADPALVLMDNVIVYNGLAAGQGFIVLTPNPDYAFEDRAALLADPDRLAAGIEEALNDVADTIARLLQ